MNAYTAADFQAALQPADPRLVDLAYLQAHRAPAPALLAQSQPMDGTLFTEQGPRTVVDAIGAVAVGPVRYWLGTWVVTDDGIACLVHRSPLTHARLVEAQTVPAIWPSCRGSICGICCGPWRSWRGWRTTLHAQDPRERMRIPPKQAAGSALTPQVVSTAVHASFAGRAARVPARTHQVRPRVLDRLQQSVQGKRQ